jgi:dinuclear metal center YbgI/SA1388 family protein
MPGTVAQALRALEARAPAGTAEAWDNVGLLVGDPGWKTAGAVVTIDLTAEAIRAAKARGHRLIVTHHPCIFPRSKGLSKVTPGLVFDAVRAGVAVAACHTNFDRCALEVVEQVSRALGARPRGRLVEKAAGSLVKLAVFVPVSHAEAVREAVCGAGAGQIGDYDSCSFQVAGTGTFRGGKGTSPFLGRPGQLESVEEMRLETIFPKGLERPVLEALFRAHPYEEVAYDLYPVEQGPAQSGIVRGQGYGFWGELEGATSFPELCRRVKAVFDVLGFWVTDSPGKLPKRRVQRVAFVAGKGAAFIDVAAASGCDLFITGEAGYHSALHGSRRGMAVLELGHRESERFFPSTVAGWLRKEGFRAVELDLPTQTIWRGGKQK